MTISLPSPERNVERIRQKNLEDNQLFLEKLLMTDIRSDFVNSARSILRKDGGDQIRKHFPRPYPKVEHATRYKEKVKTGEITPHVPEWQRLLEEKKKAAEKKKQENERLRMERLLQKERKKEEYERKRQENEKKRLEIEQRREENEKKRLEIERRREDNRREKEEFLLERELRKIERQLKVEERIKIRLAKRRRKRSKWTVFRQNNPHPYQRSFIPRHTKVGDRAEQNFS